MTENDRREWIFLTPETQYRMSIVNIQFYAVFFFVVLFQADIKYIYGREER